MERFFFESDEAVLEAAQTLKGLGRSAHKLLAECVENQELRRSAVSAAAEALHTAGFIFIVDRSTVFEKRFDIRPSLAGEEALFALEAMESCASRGIISA